MYKLKKVTKIYKDGSSIKKALDGFSLSFPSKGFVLIYGKSGCGKSTLLNLLGFLDTPSSGLIIYKGEETAKFSYKRKSKIRKLDLSYVFQHFNLIEELSVLDNLLLINSDLDLASKLLKEFDIYKYKDFKVFKLSGGQKQRVAIARSLMKNPSILLCDEPTGALDRKNSKVVKNILLELAKTRLVVVVSHDVDLFLDSSTLFVKLEEGKIVLTNLSSSIKESYTQPLTIKEHKGNLLPLRKEIFIKGKKKNTLCLLSLCLMEVIFSCCLGFKKASNEIYSSIDDNSLDSSLFSISKKEKISTSPSFSLVRETKPELVDLSFLNENVDIINPLSFVLSSSEPFYYQNQKQNPVGFFPFFNSDFKTFSSFAFEESILKTEPVCFVNDLFLSSYPSISIGDSINIEKTIKISNETGFDEIDFSIKFLILKSYGEFSFLNVAKIYYYYDFLSEYCSSLILENYSSIRKENISLLDYIAMADLKSKESGLCYWLHATNKSGRDYLFNLIKEFEKEEVPLSIYSRIGVAKNSYYSLSSSLSICLNIFSIFSLLLCAILLLLECFYSYLQNRKTSAILGCLGLNKSKIINLYSINSLFVSLSSFALSIPLSYFLFSILNNNLSPKLKLPFLISNPFLNYNGIYFFLPLLLLLFTFSIYLLSILILKIVLIKRPLYKELKDE